MKRNKCVYEYRLPESDGGHTYYVGQGNYDRPYNPHPYKGRKRNPCIKPKDKNQIVIIKDNLTEQEAKDLEIELIAKHGRLDLGEGYLVNKTDGGEGTNGYIVSEETKLKIGEGVKANHGHKDGLKESHKSKIKKTMAGTRIGSKNPMHGRKQKESTKQKMREAWKTRERKKWICNEDGALLVPKKDPLPEGYQFGMIYRGASINTDYLDDLSWWDGPA